MNNRMTAQQLKNSILQMAVQGKLVPQDPNDEPASVLLERIREEKQKLIKEGKIKKDKNESFIYRGSDNLHYEKVSNEIRCIEDELPFDIPDSWEWQRISFLGNLQRGSGIKRSEILNRGFGCIRYGELYTTYNEFFNEAVSFVSEDIFNKGKKINYGDLVFTLTGENKKDIAKCSAYLGIDTIVGGGDLAIWSCHNMNPLYLSYFMSSPFAITQKISKATGDIIIHISCDKVGSFLIPVPPLKEQEKIVNRIMELEPFIQKYEIKEKQLSSLDNEFKDKLKKSILQYAIEGKLVSQNPNDEPASVLLEQIRQEKQRLISEGKIKKDKNESIIFRRDNSYYEKQGKKEILIDDEIPFKIPYSWEWIRLGTVMNIARGGSPRPINQFITNSSNGVNWIKIGDTEKGGKYINNVKEKIKPEGVSKSRMVYKGDFLLTNSMSFGRPYILNVDGCIHDGWLVISNTFKAYNIDFLYYLLSSNFAYNQFCQNVSGAVVKNLNSDKVSNSLFPIPPIKEQIEIANMLDKMSLLLK